MLCLRTVICYLAFSSSSKLIHLKKFSRTYTKKGIILNERERGFLCKLRSFISLANRLDGILLLSD